MNTAEPASRIMRRTEAPCVSCVCCVSLPAAMMFLSVQMMLCYAVSLLYSGSSEDEEEEEEEQEVDCKQHKCQQQHNDWAIMAEEGRGLYEKLLSYT